MADTGCCPKGSEPALTDAGHTCRGTESTLGDLPIYTVGQGSTAILVNYDIFGYNGGRIRYICDILADKGYYVILPDYFRGDSYPVDAEIEPNTFGNFIKKHPFSIVKSDVEEKVLPFLEKEGKATVGLLGFCWGGWVNMHLSVNEKFAFTANIHPAFNIENFHGTTDNKMEYFFANKEVDFVKEVKIPQLIYSTSNDLPSIKEGGEVLTILKGKPFADKCVFHDFPEVVHGFATRGDLEKPEVAAAFKFFFEGILKFFGTNVSHHGCCPPGSEPHLAATHKARGTDSTIGDLPIYTVGDAGKSAIIVNYDIYGFKAGRIRFICDQLAEQGHFVILPDHFRGEPFPEDGEVNPETLTPFVTKHPWTKISADLVDKVVPFLKEKGIEKIGTLGFCWGAWVNLHLSATGLVECSASAHPSFQAEMFFGGNEVDLAKTVKCPQLIFPAGNDLPNVKEGGEIVNWLKEQSFGDRCVFREFPAVVHGYATRGDVEKPEGAAAFKGFFAGVTKFFATNLV